MDIIVVNSVNRSIGSWKNCYNFVFDNKRYFGLKYGFYFNGFKIYMKFFVFLIVVKLLFNNIYLLLIMFKLGGKLGFLVYFYKIGF